MEKSLRQAFNAAYTDEFYTRYLAALEARVGCPIPFRVAETPLFMPPKLRDRLAKAANEIVALLSPPEHVETMKRAIPAHLNAPGMDALPNCVQVDFAITRDANGELDGRVVELQGFPSLYALMVLQSDVMGEELRKLPGLDHEYSLYFSGYDKASFTAKFARAVLGGEDPEEVVLLDIDPPSQKTYPDFAATKMLVGIDAVCPTTLRRDGRKLYRTKNGKSVQVKRIYNRIVFDEMLGKGVEMPFKHTDDLDITWFSHPNWYWAWSKYTLPYVDHSHVPRARTVADVLATGELPEDLSGHVMKPLFSFAGAGVLVDPTREQVLALPEDQRANWLLQEKIVYEPALTMPDGNGVKAEVRMMFMRGPDDAKPELCLNLVRLSRGKMLGVDQNRDLTWVGGSVGIWPV